MSIKVVIVGGRGYTGAELLPLINDHPDCELIAVGSSSVQGEPVSKHISGMDDCQLSFVDLQADNLNLFPADLYILALPNGRASDYVSAIDRVSPESVIIDLSADFRFDESWTYGQPERFESEIRAAKRIANPGCYATGAQLALAPLLGQWKAIPVVFGVSGYSGAGKTPSRKNDLKLLADNLMPYALNDHIHEREVSHHFNSEVRLLPHVAPFFRGISLTLALELKQATNEKALFEQFNASYKNDPLIDVQQAVPELPQVRGQQNVILGGFSVGADQPQKVSLVCVLDNLLKGAASQAVQNLNLAFGLAPLSGLNQNKSTKSGK
jgi:N-acetyl-gamma-glutamyl-phosphate reductase